jgi:hypothetical protein
MRESGTKLDRIIELEGLYNSILADTSLSIQQIRTMLRTVERPIDLRSKWRKATPTMTSKANGVTYEAYRAKGWTDALLREHGYIK